MILNKLKYGAINNKKIIIFLLGLCIIGIIGGSLFMTFISKNEQTTVINYTNNFIKNINNINYHKTIISSLITNFLFIIVIWLLGISIIGIPIILFMYFSKLFTLGFTLSSFIMAYKTKGLFLAFLYLFPNQIFNIGIYTLITLYAIKISNNLIYSVFNKREVIFRKIINKYIYIFIICLIAITISTLYDNLLIPNIYKYLIPIIKI